MHLQCLQHMSIWSCWHMCRHHEALNKSLTNYRSGSSTALPCMSLFSHRQDSLSQRFCMESRQAGIQERHHTISE